MPVDLTIVESTTELGQTVVEVVLESASAPGPTGPGVATGGTVGQVLKKASSTDFDTLWDDPAAPGAHATSHQDGGADEISIAGLAGTSAALQAHLDDAVDAHDASAISFTPDGSIAATTVQAAIVEVRDEAGGGGAPTDVDYLVGTASGGLSAEIVVGTTPGGELGGTWASPTVDATHSGSTHAAVQAAAEATAAAALSAHLTDVSDAHDASAISVDSTTLSGTGTDVQAALEEIDNLLDDHSARHENGGADEISIAGLDGTPTELTNHLNDVTAAHAASAISYAGNTGLSSTDVEAALDELDNEKQPLDSDLTAIAALTTDAAGRGLLTLTDPGADRILFWDDSAGAFTHLTVGTNLTITDTTIDASGSGSSEASYVPSFLFMGA